MIALLIFLLGTSAQAEDLKPQLTIEIVDVRSGEGDVAVAVFPANSNFPHSPEKAVFSKKLKAEKGTVSLNISDLKPGDYALSVFHDEDRNGKMGFSFLGIPREGFGFSRNKRIYFGPPSFDDAKVSVTKEPATHQIKMKYF